jgi:hypothetical protein
MRSKGIRVHSLGRCGPNKGVRTTRPHAIRAQRNRAGFQARHVAVDALRCVHPLDRLRVLRRTRLDKELRARHLVAGQAELRVRDKATRLTCMRRRLTITEGPVERRVQVQHKASIPRPTIADRRMATDTLNAPMCIVLLAGWKVHWRVTALAPSSCKRAPRFLHMRQKSSEYRRLCGLTVR